MPLCTFLISFIIFRLDCYHHSRSEFCSPNTTIRKHSLCTHYATKQQIFLPNRPPLKPKIQTNDNKAQNTKRYGLLITELNKECVVCNLNLLYQINIMHKFWNKCTNYFSIFGTIRQFGSWGHFALENTIISFDDVGNGNQSGHFFLRCTKVIGIILDKKGNFFLQLNILNRCHSFLYA